MKKIIPKSIIGAINLTLFVINILIWPFIIFLVALLRFIPIKPWKVFCNRILQIVPVIWMAGNNLILKTFTSIEWDIQGAEKLKPNDWYFLICNHQTWADIPALGFVLNRKVPALKFFMKRELLWTMPVVGLAAYLIDCPVLYRHTKEYLAKHPKQKGKDVELTRKACEKFKNHPTTVINFVEGTRFTQEKHNRQTSPYRYLLRPRSGGIAFALAAMDEYFHKILNVTIVYGNKNPTLWNYLSGNIPKIIVRVEALEITPDLRGDYENNREYRVYFQQWLNRVWENKDKLIDKLRKTL